MDELRLWKGLTVGAVSVFDEVFSPAAARARDHLQADHERRIPTPSPGDRLLDDGRIVIIRNSTAKDDD